MQNYLKTNYRSIRESLVMHKVKYFLALIHSKAISYFLRKKEDVSITKKQTRKIVIIYSKAHFDPTNDNETKLLSRNSAANIARNIYGAFPDYDRTYLDASEKKVLPGADIIIGVPSQAFIYQAKRFPHAQKILFLVNSHPLFRMKVLIKEMHLLNRHIPFNEYLSPYVFLKCFRLANKAILIGNAFVKNTYDQYGIDTSNIYLINSGVNFKTHESKELHTTNKKMQVLFVASSLSMRKGIFRVMESWDILQKEIEQDQIELIMIGKIDSYIENDIKVFVNKHKNCKALGWIDSSTKEYQTILENSHVVVAPSLEEGQVGSVLEAMALGAVPIVTPACGIDIPKGAGFVIKNHKDTQSIANIIKYLSANPEELETFSLNTKKYIARKHSWQEFQNHIRERTIIQHDLQPQKMEIIDIVLSIYNQEKLIERVLYGLFKNTTTPFNLILVFDGCTDRTKPRAMKYIEKYRPQNLQKVTVREAKNVFETKANNIGYKAVTSDFFITLQDDMVIQEKGWERRLTFPLRIKNDVLAVSARMAHDIDMMDETHQQYINLSGRDLGPAHRNIFAIRDVINRGPIAFRTKFVKKLNYLNEDYAPSDLDDADLCLRGWRDYRWKVGSFQIQYLSRLEWGKTRANDSTMNSLCNASRNQARLGRDHRTYIDSKIKHGTNTVIENTEIDYFSNPQLPFYFYYPYRLDTYHLKCFIETHVRGSHYIFKIFDKISI